jgi:hypothetical protein
MFGFNPYVILGAGLLMAGACTVSYYKGRESVNEEVLEQQRKAFEKALADREEVYQKDLVQASKSTEVIKIVKEKGEEKIRYVEKLVKEDPTPVDCHLTAGSERMRILTEIAESTQRTADSE